jgi:pyrroloquinoline quinone biosynthesis protein D
MSKVGTPERIVLVPSSVPALPRHVKLRHDTARNCWLVLAPERVFTPDPIALEVLQLCDGARNVDAIAEALAARYAAPKARILTDIISMLQDLADKGVMSA